MRIIHVLRKPLSEGTVASNVLKHGCGGLNIDASRISGDGSHMRPIQPTNNDRVVYGAQAGFQPTNHKGGRWPANVILQHLDGCRCAGVKKVKAISGGASSGDNAFGQDSGRNAHQNRPTNITRQGDKDGKESVANWICELGCPVARLDEQSGVTKSTGGRTVNISATSMIYGGGKGLGQAMSSDEVRGDPGFGDIGGASRFYKKVGGMVPE